MWQQLPEFILFQLYGVRKQLRQLAQEKENVKDSGTGIQMMYIAYCILPAPNSKASCSYLPPPPSPSTPLGYKMYTHLTCSHPTKLHDGLLSVQRKGLLYSPDAVLIWRVQQSDTLFYICCQSGALLKLPKVYKGIPLPLCFLWKTAAKDRHLAYSLGCPAIYLSQCYL